LCSLYLRFSIKKNYRRRCNFCTFNGIRKIFRERYGNRIRLSDGRWHYT